MQLPSRPAPAGAREEVPPRPPESPFSPSKRALETYKRGHAWDLMQEMAQRPRYDPESQPDGLINLSGAENCLMEDWMRRYVEENVTTAHEDILAGMPYGTISGTPKLLQAAAGFFNEFFGPSEPIRYDQILATNGVTSAIELAAWTLCDPGDAILYPTPNFYMLDYDLAVRTDVEAVPVSTSALHNAYDAAEAADLVRLFDEAAGTIEARGVRCRAVFLSNPANPEGRCYSAATLAVLAAWCRGRGMHLVADEIYSMGQFQPADGPEEQFSSVLGIPVPADGLANVHSLYGMSKDFNMGGLRIGFFVTRNAAVREALSRVTWFTWISAFSAEFVARFLGRLDLVRDYLGVYRKRLGEAYRTTAAALHHHGIPFRGATAGLFVYLDLGKYIRYFPAPTEVGQPSEEVQLCKYLADSGVFLNPGQFAGSDQPGHFRLVFTEFSGHVELAISRMRKALDGLEAS